MRGKAYPDETRAAVMAALIAGQSVTAVASEFSIPLPTVDRWAKSVELRTVENKKEIGELTRTYLETLLEGLSEQVKHVSTENYVSKQPAGEIAILHGVMADKAFRLLASAIAASGNGRPVHDGESAERGGTGTA